MKVEVYKVAGNYFVDFLLEIDVHIHDWILLSSRFTLIPYKTLKQNEMKCPYLKVD